MNQMEIIFFSVFLDHINWEINITIEDNFLLTGLYTKILLNDDQESLIRYLNSTKPDLFGDTLLKWISSNLALDGIEIDQFMLNSKHRHLFNHNTNCTNHYIDYNTIVEDWFTDSIYREKVRKEIYRIKQSKQKTKTENLFVVEDLNKQRLKNSACKAFKEKYRKDTQINVNPEDCLDKYKNNLIQKKTNNESPKENKSKSELFCIENKKRKEPSSSKITKEALLLKAKKFSKIKKPELAKLPFRELEAPNVNCGLNLNLSEKEEIKLDSKVFPENMELIKSINNAVFDLSQLEVKIMNKDSITKGSEEQVEDEEGEMFFETKFNSEEINKIE